jgi:RNA-splicing ligase RtcB
VLKLVVPWGRQRPSSTSKTGRGAPLWIDPDDGGGFYRLETGDTGEVPVRMFVTERLLAEAEPTLYRQIVNATRFPGAKLVCITPDVHYGYGVPVGCVILTDRERGAVAMGPVGFDIGCGMMSARSRVPAELATPDRKRAFNEEVTRRVALGAGGRSIRLGRLSTSELQNLVRGGAEMPEAGAAKSGYSVNHGAGRRLSRGEAMRSLDQRKVDEQYRRDGILVNLDGRVPLDESSACYKSAEEVVSAVVAAKLARIEHTLWPLASIKGDEKGASRSRQRAKKVKDRARGARRTKGHH